MSDVLLDTDNLSQKLTQTTQPGVIPKPLRFDDTQDTSLAGSLFRQENIFGSVFEQRGLNARLNQYKADPEYRYEDNVPDDLFEYRDRFVFTNSMEQRDEVAQQLRKELNDKQTISDSPVAGFFLGMVIGNLDPSIILPGGTIYRNAKRSVGFLKSAAAGSIAAAVSAGAQESVLNPTQLTREIDESVYNVLGAALFGSVLGGIGGAFASGPIGKKAQKDIVDTLVDGYGPARDGNLSSAKVKEFEPEYIAQSEGLARMGRFVTKAAGLLFPMTRLMESPFNVAKGFVDNAYEHNMIKNKNTEAFGSQANPINVESKLKLEFGVVRKAFTEYQDVFFKQAGVENGILKNLQSMVSRTGLKWADYDTEVAKALRNDGKHTNPDVVAGAKILRDKIFDPLKEQAIGLGLLPKNVDVKTALAYFTRVYNTQRIKEMPDSFRASIVPYLKQKNEELKQLQPVINTFRKNIGKAKSLSVKKTTEKRALQKLLKKKKKTPEEVKALAELEASQAKLSAEQAEALLARAEKELDDAVPHDLKDSDGQIRKVVDDEQIDAISRQILDNVLGRNEAKILNPMMGKFQSSGKAKPLNNRAFLIPDELIEDWTLNSASKVTEMYSKAMIPTLELNKFARRVDSPLKRQAQQDSLTLKAHELEDRLELMSPEEKIAAQIEIGELYQRVEELSVPTPGQVQGHLLLDLKQELDGMKVGKTPEQNAKLEKQYDQAVEDINATFELLQGVYGSGQNVMDNSMAKVANNIKTWNFLRMMGSMTLSSLPDVGMHIMRHGPMAFMKEGLMPFIKGFAGERMNKAFLKDMGVSIESLIGTRLKSYIDHESTTESVSVWGKGLDFMSDTFGSVSLMNSWQDMNQYIAGNMSIARTLRSVIEGASKADIERLNVLGISKESREIIADQWKIHGGEKDGSYFINIGDWGLDDPKVAKAYDEFRVSIVKEVDSTVVRPGLGDKPLIGNTQLGQLLFQFKSFVFASTTRVLASGLSRNDANFYMGVVSMLALGTLRYVITSKIRKPDEEVDLSFAKVSREAIDASGLLGVFSEVYNIGNKALGLSDVSRYQSRGIVGSLAGPSFGGLEEIVSILNKSSRSIQDENVNFTTKDAEKFMRLFPYQNLFYLYNLNRIVTKKAALGLGFEETN